MKKSPDSNDLAQKTHMITSHPLLSYLIGVLFACAGSYFVVRPAVKKLWSIAKEDFETKGVEIPPFPIRAHPTITFWQSMTEVVIYTSSVALSKPEGIAVWLAFKAIMRWKASDKDDPRHIPGSLIYMFGTALNVGLGVLGGFIALGYCHF
ncbi:hypothetical protein [Methyloglobulus sp.]|uniref:hypothetical protein n=1 Tax=Methyloglobulus sp. TaxID=2518622 RepID=UPI00398966C9